MLMSITRLIGRRELRLDPDLVRGASSATSMLVAPSAFAGLCKISIGWLWDRRDFANGFCEGHTLARWGDHLEYLIHHSIIHVSESRDWPSAADVHPAINDEAVINVNADDAAKGNKIAGVRLI
jgi:hypothetical protein